MTHYHAAMEEYLTAPAWNAPAVVTNSELLAPSLLLFTALIFLLEIVGPKTTVQEQVRYVILSLVCSLTMGFGIIFTSTWVGVYV